MVDVVGIDHVCIGTDTKLTPGNGPGGPDGAAQKKGGGPAQKKGGGEARKKGGGPGGGRMGGGTTNQAWADQKVGFYHAVINEMLKQSFGNAKSASLVAVTSAAYSMRPRPVTIEVA
jgi:membrane dipeptidase